MAENCHRKKISYRHGQELPLHTRAQPRTQAHFDTIGHQPEPGHTYRFATDLYICAQLTPTFFFIKKCLGTRQAADDPKQRLIRV